MQPEIFHDLDMTNEISYDIYEITPAKAQSLNQVYNTMEVVFIDERISELKASDQVRCPSGFAALIFFSEESFPSFLLLSSL